MNGIEMTFKVCFDIKNLGLYGRIPGIRKAMEHELIRVYNKYAHETNNGITEMLNEEFNRTHPDYFEKNQDKDWYELTLYNRFMADGYQRLIVDKYNENKESCILDFFVDPEEVVFTGKLKKSKNTTIRFYMKQA